jgi:hypothetical protein
MDFLRAHSSDISSVESRPFLSRLVETQVPALVFRFLVSSEGIYMSYRWYDQQKITPLFAFGHGLSYTEFAYSDLEIRRVRDGLEVRFIVQNTGQVKGSEVPQVYVGSARPSTGSCTVHAAEAGRFQAPRAGAE